MGNLSLRARPVEEGSAAALKRTASMKRSFWRHVLAWRARWFQRHRWNRLVLERVGGTPVLVLPQVFNPSLFRSSALLVQQLHDGLLPVGATVLDMGTGTGIGAIVAAQRASRVVAVDVNPAAVRCARINALLNHVEDRVEVRLGDLFAPLEGQRFDVVLFNPPYFRGVPRDAADQAWRSTDVVERFAAGLGQRLEAGGHALVVLSTDGERDAFLRAFAEHGFSVDAVAERDLINETLAVYRLRIAGR